MIAVITTCKAGSTMSGRLLDENFCLLEGNQVGLRAGPDVVYLRMTRRMDDEVQTTTMLVELSLSDAANLSRGLQACLVSASQLGDPPAE